MPPPNVTGISPKEGPPGTKVTIRGENLGTEPRDLIGLRICGVDCLLSAEWKSRNKIVVRTGQAKMKGEIIVVTLSGGVGSCTVSFRGYVIQIGPLQDSAVWIDESQTMNFGRHRAHSPLSSQSYDDPLGICDEVTDAKFSEDRLKVFFQGGSGNTSQENFVPQWYLLENHHGTSFEDLKTGLEYLKKKSSERHEGPLAFVKENLTNFMDCQDALADMHKQFMTDKQVSNGAVTGKLEDVLQKANKSADSLFQDVLGRKDKADATRSALGVLQRFRFLFNLTSTIDRNIKKGDYDLVITDYTRAKSLFGDTDIQLFRKVYREVENRISAFREMLKKRLMELPSSVDEQKKLIRYLVHLEAAGDPAWECLENMQRWIINLLNNCNQQYISQESDSKSGTADNKGMLSPSRTLIRRQGSFKHSGKAPQKVLFIETLTKILMESFPDLWRLGQSYFSGKLLKDAKEKSTD